jgi:hypothetical protein
MLAFDLTYGYRIHVGGMGFKTILVTYKYY